MKSTLTMRTILAAVLLVASTATVSIAQSPPPGPGGRLEGTRGPMGRTDGELWLMIRAANLTTEQQARVRGILSTHRATTRPLIEQLRQVQQELGDKLLAPGPLQPRRALRIADEQVGGRERIEERAHSLALERRQQDAAIGGVRERDVGGGIVPGPR